MLINDREQELLLQLEDVAEESVPKKTMLCICIMYA
jgi:hypothetical protein